MKFLLILVSAFILAECEDGLAQQGEGNALKRSNELAGRSDDLVVYAAERSISRSKREPRKKKKKKKGPKKKGPKTCHWTHNNGTNGDKPAIPGRPFHIGVANTYKNPHGFCGNYTCFGNGVVALVGEPVECDGCLFLGDVVPLGDVEGHVFDKLPGDDEGKCWKRVCSEQGVHKHEDLECKLETIDVTYTFVDGETWDDDLSDPTSAAFSALMKDIEDLISSLGIPGYYDTKGLSAFETEDGGVRLVVTTSVHTSVAGYNESSIEDTVEEAAAVFFDEVSILITNGNGSCEDRNDDCQGWADEGECENNPDYMLHQCKKSCNTCQECTDISETDVCRLLETYGKCGDPEVVMNCGTTCGYCPPECVDLAPTDLCALIDAEGMCGEEASMVHCAATCAHC